MGKYVNSLLFLGTKGSPQKTFYSEYFTQKNILDRLTILTGNKEGVERIRKSVNKNSLGKMNVEKQNRHMPGTKEYTEGRSVITIGIDRLKELVEKYWMDGVIHPSGRITVDLHEIVGYDLNPITGKKTKTSLVTIHPSKTGYHVVPTNPNMGENNTKTIKKKRKK